MPITLHELYIIFNDARRYTDLEYYIINAYAYIYFYVPDKIQ
jgi:hypothetical protein